MRGPGCYFLYGHGYANRGGLGYLHQRVWHIDVSGEDGTVFCAGRVDGIGGGCVYFLDVTPGAGDGDAGRLGVDLDDLFSVGKVAGNAGMNLDLARGTSIKGQMELAGDD